MRTEEEIRQKLQEANTDRERIQREIQQLIVQQAAIKDRASKLRNDLIACNGVIAGLLEALGEQHPASEPEES